VPHPIAPRTDCRVCHDLDGVLPFPDDHVSYEDNLCIQCHEPIMTVGDVKLEIVQSPPIPHTLDGRRDQCLTCHGEDAFKPYPADHVGRATDTCLYCHQQAETAKVEEASSPETTSEESPASEAEVAGPSPIPHPLEGRDDCSVCHSLAGVKPFPADHEGRTIETCLSCHQAGTPAEAESTPAVEPGETPTPEPEEPEETPTPEPEETEETPTAEPEETSGPSLIPHTLEGRDDCLLCHSLDGVRPFPEDHIGRTSVMCTACHQPQGEGEGS
jgi:hypothetical protein